jgi:hypothetical protein
MVTGDYVDKETKRRHESRNDQYLHTKANCTCIRLSQFLCLSRDIQSLFSAQMPQMCMFVLIACGKFAR